MRAEPQELRQFVEKIERLNSEKDDIAEMKKEVFADAKGRGYDAAIMRKQILRRKMNPDDVAAGDAALDLYEKAVNGGN
jgi:uncharacterized protein (UPF0335 family)